MPTKSQNLETETEHQNHAEEVEKAREGGEENEATSELGEKIESEREIHERGEEGQKPLMQEKGGRVCI